MKFKKKAILLEWNQFYKFWKQLYNLNKCKNNGINIITVQQDGLSSRISLEKLFNNDDFKNLILESDYHFLKYVLIEPGLNLRNKSAHGLDLSIYNFSNANLLLLCLLRIIKYL